MVDALMAARKLLIEVSDAGFVEQVLQPSCAKLEVILIGVAAIDEERLKIPQRGGVLPDDAERVVALPHRPTFGNDLARVQIDRKSDAAREA